MLPNCNNMAPFMQVLFNLVISISCCHRTVSFDLNSFSTRPPGPGGGSWQPADVRTPPGRGGHFMLPFLHLSCLNVPVCCILSLANDIGHLITNTEIHAVYTFSVRGISCKKNVTFQVKLIPFFAGICVGLDFSDFL